MSDNTEKQEFPGMVDDDGDTVVEGIFRLFEQEDVVESTEKKLKCEKRLNCLTIKATKAIQVAEETKATDTEDSKIDVADGVKDKHVPVGTKTKIEAKEGVPAGVKKRKINLWSDKQLDGDLPSIKEESSSEEEAPDSSDSFSDNFTDDDDDEDGVMCINGKEYVFKTSTGSK